MVEVFKTDVKNQKQANELRFRLKKCFEAYEVNFDLQDCDKILRVKCEKEEIQTTAILQLLSQLNIRAEVL